MFYARQFCSTNQPVVMQFEAFHVNIVIILTMAVISCLCQLSCFKLYVVLMLLRIP